ncbi:hypothetical protein SODALDRAFT_354454 [Sodiomyces alkalinus F11]|uniref:Uncharacterized protein n=1 Tax=Sodiomyces alkalinus (strain CBS 110278 / VKM F-3762 / F11) TaxID=1314773 RepID=A0A3N2Q6B1_SODAK|nr:hypothetical protein SODALDRAFT_354454 [Sodiomyces alkalinus F11]ROT42323.1 hypothetical protein SODALDRAFT_354454 [Sodiomyces alkalinus F11]
MKAAGAGEWGREASLGSDLGSMMQENGPSGGKMKRRNDAHYVHDRMMDSWLGPSCIDGTAWKGCQLIGCNPGPNVQSAATSGSIAKDDRSIWPQIQHRLPVVNISVNQNQESNFTELNERPCGDSVLDRELWGFIGTGQSRHTRSTGQPTVCDTVCRQSVIVMNLITKSLLGCELSLLAAFYVVVLFIGPSVYNLPLCNDTHRLSSVVQTMVLYVVSCRLDTGHIQRSGASPESSHFKCDNRVGDWLHSD